MKKYILNIIIAIICALGASSCKGFLDTRPTNSVVDKIVMATLYDAGIAVNGLYMDMKYYTYYGRDLTFMGDMRADNLYPRIMGGQSNMIYTLEYESGANSYFSLWNNFYSNIMKANAIIVNIDNLQVKKEDDIKKKNDYLGQAYAVRAFVYFDIARLYGYPYMFDKGSSLGAVLITKPIAPSQSRIPRKTVAETYNFILSDLDKAIGLLSKDKNFGHFNYWSAKLLQARVYLYKGDFANAYSSALEVINSSPYSLVSNKDYIEYWGHENQAESVLEFIVTNEGDIDPDGGFYSMYHHLWFEDTNAGASVIPTKKWRELFEKTPNDVRAKFIMYDDPKTGVKKTGDYWLKKFVGNKDRGYTFRRNNPRIMRVTEAYLIASEAALETGKITEANNYLNIIRKRADPSTVDVIANIDLIQIERQKEFIGEGHRFFDVMRRGGKITRDMSVDEHDYAGKYSFSWDDYRVALPISSNERVLYPELQQNPGYKN